jgi:maltose alpha-D-glucosyltransferase/alpha-amylase
VFWYGEEIGMGDALDLHGRNAVRTPMQWGDRENAGFSSAESDRLVRPLIADGPFGYPEVNVDAQRRDPESLLSWIERMLRTRRECPEFGWGRCEFCEVETAAVLVHRCRRGDGSVLLVHNLSDSPQPVTVRLLDDRSARALLADDREPVGRGQLRVALPPFGYKWFRESIDDRER